MRELKLAQLRLCLTNLLIKIREDKIRIKLKKLYKVYRITERHWWLSLDKTALIHQIPKNKREYFKLKKNSAEIIETYLNKEKSKRLNWETSKRKENSILSSQMRNPRKTTGVSSFYYKKKSGSLAIDSRVRNQKRKRNVRTYRGRKKWRTGKKLDERDRTAE